ncbi:MAG TPA: tetratricopeptide repeat protein [Chloroflexi bacterium]|nr:tetratricopeptide repeat protein [Chloroflexota bacterium]
MAQPVNPYVAGASVRGKQGFFGRQDTLDWVAHGLCNPVTNSLVLFGQRRIGKTSLLLHLCRTLPAHGLTPIYFDLQDQAARSLGQVLSDMADVIVERVGVEPPDPSLFDDRGLFFGRTFLPQVCTMLEDRRPVFLLDEFDVLDEAVEADLASTAAIHTLIRFLRRVMMNDPRPAFVFTMGRRIDDLGLDFTATFKASLVREIWVLDRESAEAMVRQAEVNKTLRFSDQAVDRILSLTRCHPYLTQLFCQHIWAQAYAGDSATLPQVGVAQVEASLPAVLEMADQALAWLWDGLSLAEKIFAAGLAGVSEEGQTVSEELGLQTLADHATRLCTRGVELMAPRDLVRRRVLDLVEERKYRFTVELFRRWVRQHKPLGTVKEELDRIDPLADELFGIGQEFFRRNQWKAAVRYFRDALAANPLHFHARLRLGETLIHVGQVDEAVSELEWCYEQDQDEARPLLARALVAQARAREEAGDEDGALAACERTTQVSPADHAAQRIRNGIIVRRLEMQARALEAEERWADASAAYERLMSQASEEEQQQRTWQAAFERCRKEMVLSRLFGEGLAALNRRNWSRAQKAFADVVHGRPDYRVGKQSAARLLWYAVAQKPVRNWGRILAVALFSVVLVAAAGAWYFQLWRKTPDVQPPVQLPERQEHVQTYRLDTDRDGDDEWIVLYRFDLSSEGEGYREPIGGVVYRTKDGESSILTPHELRPYDGDYLCECDCLVSMENVLSGLAGSELVVRDRCNGDIVRLSIFYWEPSEERYLPKGHFSGSRVEIGLNNVTVIQRLPHRAQLALRQVYEPRDNGTYYQPGELGVLVMSEQYELTFYGAEPQDVTRSPYPEKVVLAFYHHYTARGRVSGYFTDEGWARVDRCMNGRCGCLAALDDIARVRVTSLQPKGGLYGAAAGVGSDQAIFDLSLICQRLDGVPEDETSVRWYLVQRDGRWQLDDAELMPAGWNERDVP